jgi:hypothetical protein
VDIAPQVQEEEDKIRTANERALAEMKLRMEKELEDAKLELLEVGFLSITPLLHYSITSKLRRGSKRHNFR